RQNGRFPIDTRQYLATMGERSLGACQVQRSVRGDIDSAKALAINTDREWKRDFGGAVVAMIAGVGVARRDSSRAGASGIGAAPARSPGRRRRWRSSSPSGVATDQPVTDNCPPRQIVDQTDKVIVADSVDIHIRPVAVRRDPALPMGSAILVDALKEML